MGLSSNARLLSITARLTSNEYESQQVSNAKMRLATKSQQASETYLAALSTTDYAYMTFDAQGNAQNVPLTAAVLYQYGASKNQYMLSNTAGQALLSREDAYHYDKAETLKDFIESYGVKANFRTLDLAKNYEYLKENKKDLEDWQTLMDNYKADHDVKVWADAYETNKEVYNVALTNYNKMVEELSAGNETFTVTELKKNDDGTYEVVKDGETKEPKKVLYGPYEIAETEPDKIAEELKDKYDITLGDRIYRSYSNPQELLDQMAAMLSDIRTQYESTVTYDAYIESKIRNEKNDGGEFVNKDLCENYDKYMEHLNNFNVELEELGITEDEAYTYDDTTKAQWYTNLWYRINGNSTIKSANPNYAELDNKLLTSTSWIRDALAHGDISIEMGSYTPTEEVNVQGQPALKVLKGISWTTKMFSSCPDITQRDDSAAIERAEAEYQKALADINYKDEKYQRKLKNLDTEHNALQTEYESVKSALSKNIDRSFKAFQG